MRGEADISMNVSIGFLRMKRLKSDKIACKKMGCEHLYLHLNWSRLFVKTFFDVLQQHSLDMLVATWTHVAERFNRLASTRTPATSIVGFEFEGKVKSS